MNVYLSERVSVGEIMDTNVSMRHAMHVKHNLPHGLLPGKLCYRATGPHVVSCTT